MRRHRETNCRDINRAILRDELCDRIELAVSYHKDASIRFSPFLSIRLDHMKTGYREEAVTHIDQRDGAAIYRERILPRRWVSEIGGLGETKRKFCHFVTERASD